MKPSIFQKPNLTHQTLEHFINLVNRCQMKYWASDLLAKNLKPHEIREAVRRAMAACKGGGEEVKHHFQLMYTTSNHGVSFNDCKLSELGYNLTILNANPNNKFVAGFQLKLIDALV